MIGATIKNHKKRNRPIGIMVFGGYIIFQGFTLLSLQRSLGESAMLLTIAVVVLGVGILNANKIAYWAALTIFILVFFSSAITYILSDAHMILKGTYIAIAFWCLLLAGYLILPGVRCYFFGTDTNALDISEKSKQMDSSKSLQQFPASKINETLNWSTGAKYIGEIKDGKRHGTGAMHYPNGFQYIGEYINDMRHGKGTVIHLDGRKEEGMWYKNEPINGKR